MANFSVDCFRRVDGLARHSLLRKLVLGLARCGEAGDRFVDGDVFQVSNRRRGVFAIDLRIRALDELLDDGVRRIRFMSFFGDRMRSGVRAAGSLDRFDSVRVIRLVKTVGLFSTSAVATIGVRRTIEFSLFG